MGALHIAVTDLLLESKYSEAMVRPGIIRVIWCE
jgi:hypothetical protein